MKLKDITPFVELVDPLGVRADGRTNREYIRDGIRNLVGVFDKIVVVTTPGKIGQVYEYLRKECPGIRIIGGLKPFDYVGVYVDEFDTPRSERWERLGGWLDVARLAEWIAEATGIDRCVLENERVLRAFHEGKVLINPDAMEAALRPIRESSIKFDFYFPSLVPNSTAVPNRLRMTTELTAAVARAIKPSDGFMAGYQRTPVVGTRRGVDFVIHQSMPNREGHAIVENVAEMVVVHTSGKVDGKTVYTPVGLVSSCQNWPDIPIVIQVTADDFGSLAAQFREIVPVTEEPQTEESRTMVHVVNRLNFQNTLAFRKIDASGVPAFGPSLELPPLVWANAQNRGGAPAGQPAIPAIRQMGHLARCRVMFPSHEQFGGQPLDPYWCFPEIGVGLDPYDHALFGLQDGETLACMAADFPESLAPATTAKRTFAAPFIVGYPGTHPAMGGWNDIDVPLLPGYPINVINFHLARVVSV